ncbi:MAG: NfeD family protein [Acidimicrobiia bacterium]
MSQLHRPEPTGARRRLHRPAALIVGFGVLLGALGLAAPSASAKSDRTIDVIQVEGLIDPPNADLIVSAVEAANRDHAQVLLITFNSGGAVDVDASRVVDAIRRSRVPVVAWIGPSGSKARGLAALAALDASVVSVSNGSSIGPIEPVTLDGSSSLAPTVGRPTARVRHRTLGADAAAARRVTDRPCAGSQAQGCATIGDLLVALDGRTLTAAGGRVTLHTAKVVGKGPDRRRQPADAIRFRKLDLVGQAVHTLTSPSIAYFLLVVGLALVIFEFFTISIGLAGGTGAVALVGAFVGVSHLPVTWWALAVIFLAMFGYAIDVQAGRAYSWTVIGTILLVVGTLFLYGGSSRLDVYWWVIVLMVVLTVAFFVSAMPIAVRSRFSTPTIGRESLVGEMGEAAVDVAPEGVVILRGARWRARTNRATPIGAGEPIRVVEVDGLVLEVEPEEGGAKDYREPKPRAAAGPEADADGAPGI